MALNMALRTPLTLSRAVSRSSLLSQRSLSSLSTLRQTPRLRTARPSSISSPQLQLSFRRAYADAPPTVKLSPTPKPKKRFRFFRFLWRATYLSVLGGLAYLTYTIYDAKHPADQIDPDPSKKTLVILGKSMTRFRASEEYGLTICRNWMGICLATKEAGH
jgi:NADH:ubiquinone reductase (non-electrogenic)